MQISPKRLAKSILNEKKYLFTYHKNHDLLYSFVMPVILEVEHLLNMLPPLKIAKNDFKYCEEAFRSVTRRIAGYSYSIARQTIKVGFPSGDFHNLYMEDERHEIALFIFQEQESIFRETINDTLLEVTRHSDQNFYQYFRSHLLHYFLNIMMQMFKEVFLFAMVLEPQEKRPEPILAD
ncbi:hypothetical protein [Tepidibacillus fermentans]|uniref:Uncharacterized protein n=1 Tax=Tepidibacillus fermentans TaxID=1281767 RepID=A0A4R3KKG6_9BACI|nr:hypothetical protein [Tepidibacillus fermentans]TCS83210.1 hypothetical protein EDD72_106139 [Tepidibacillus fermentans]